MTEKHSDKINNIEFYYGKNRFFNMFFSLKKYKELFFTKEAFFSMIMSLIFTVIITNLIPSVSYQADFSNNIRDILGIVIGGLFGLLGFTIGGLAIIIGTLGNEIIEKINDDNKINHLMSIIFNFYLSGAVTGVSIILSAAAYIITFSTNEINKTFFIITNFMIGYFIFFSLVYTIMLLGTCIRLFILKYFYSHKNENSSSSNGE